MKLSEQSLLDREALLKKTIREKKNALKKAPKGRLRYYLDGRCIKYYHCMSPLDHTGTYIKKTDEKLASALAQKNYDERVLQKAEAELEALAKLISKYKDGTMENIYPSLREARKRLIEPVELPDEEYIELWKEKNYKIKPVVDQAADFITENCERVRSKSELIIADTLYREKIPYQYEVPIRLNGAGIIHPDFRVLNIKQRKTYYWEHLGKMDDPIYAENAIKRIQSYEKNGLFPGDKLLLTFETQRKPLGTRQIKMMIEKFLK